MLHPDRARPPAGGRAIQLTPSLVPQA
jgi:hypothetical protein